MTGLNQVIAERRAQEGGAPAGLVVGYASKILDAPEELMQRPVRAVQPVAAAQSSPRGNRRVTLRSQPPGNARAVNEWRLSITRCEVSSRADRNAKADLLREYSAIVSKDCYAPFDVPDEYRSERFGNAPVFTVSCEYEGGRMTVAGSEIGMPVILPPGATSGIRYTRAAQDFTIVAARYGSGLNWADVTRYITILPAEDGCNLAVDRDAMQQQNAVAGDRARLVLWYDYRGVRFAHVGFPGEALFMPTAAAEGPAGN